MLAKKHFQNQEAKDRHNVTLKKMRCNKNDRIYFQPKNSPRILVILIGKGEYMDKFGKVRMKTEPNCPQFG